MTSSTGPYTELASHYDLLVGEYDAAQTALQVRFLQRIWNESAPRPVRRVLEAGCGTGRVALALAAAGYDVTGVDSCREMVEIAQSKPVPANGAARFDTRDIREVDADRFDAACMLFGGFNYLLEDADVESALRSFRNSVRSGGTLVLDLTNFHAAIGSFRPARVKAGRSADCEFHRSVENRCDDLLGRWHVNAWTTVSRAGETPVMWHEHHELRMISRNEICERVAAAGFRDVTWYGSFEDPTERPSSGPRIVVVAR